MHAGIVMAPLPDELKSFMDIHQKEDRLKPVELSLRHQLSAQHSMGSIVARMKKSIPCRVSTRAAEQHDTGTQTKSDLTFALETACFAS